VQTCRGTAADDLGDLVVQHEKRHAAFHIAISLAPQPRQYVCSESDRAPGFQRFRLLDTEVSQFRPDGNSRIRGENIGGKSHIVETLTDLAHDTQCFGAVSLAFTRIAQNQIERGPDFSLPALARSLEHIRDLVVLLHPLQNLG
jgi:hypothetical protein